MPDGAYGALWCLADNTTLHSVTMSRAGYGSDNELTKKHYTSSVHCLMRDFKQIWIEYLKAIGQMSDEPWKFFSYTVLHPHGWPLECFCFVLFCEFLEKLFHKVVSTVLASVVSQALTFAFGEGFFSSSSSLALASSSASSISASLTAASTPASSSGASVSSDSVWESCNKI